MAKNTVETEKQPETPQTPPQSAPEPTPEPTVVSAPPESIENPESPDSPDSIDVPDSLDALAMRHRVPAWQMAALMRMMDWVGDKRVSDAEFADAMARLSRRPLGGGRL